MQLHSLPKSQATMLFSPFITRTNVRVKRLSYIRHSGSVSMFLPSSMGGTNSRPLIQPVTMLTSSVRPCFSARRQSV